MPITYDIDLARELITVEIEGDNTLTELLAACRTWLSDPTFRPELNTLCLTSGVRSIPTLSELIDVVSFIKEQAKQHARTFGRKKVAIVTTQPITFAVARQFSALAPGTLMTVQVFHDRDAAVEWLKTAPA